MNASNSSVFHLIMESANVAPVSDATRAKNCSDVSPYALALPGSLSILRTARDKAPEVCAEPVEFLVDELIVEPVLTRDSVPRLALANHADRQLFINGVRAPRFSLLRERDQFQFDDSCIFHVTIFCQPQIGPAPAEKVGKPCPICLAPFTDDPNAICYRCQCDTVLHLKDPRGLECARAVNECPHCKQPITLKAGYTWLPEFCH